MSSYLYRDANGIWIGPCTVSQLKELAAKNIIARDTMIERPDGVQQHARWLDFLPFGQNPSQSSAAIPVTPVQNPQQIMQAPPELPTVPNAQQYIPPSKQTVVYVNAPQQAPPSQALPALVSLFLPGVGQLIQGRVTAWILWQICWGISLCLCLLIIGFITTPILSIACVIDAAKYNPFNHQHQKKTSTALKLLLAGGTCCFALIVLVAIAASLSSSIRQSVEQNPLTQRAQPQPSERRAGSSIKLTIKDYPYVFHWCPPGTFMMGDSSSQHQVTLTQGFWMMETPVPQRNWESIMGSNPSYFKNGDGGSFGGRFFPVENVSWDDCQRYIKRLNDLKVAPAGFKFVLPTEAQWEYACRSGTTTAYSFGDTLSANQANFSESRLNRTTEVGKYRANAWGLKDMHGNVWEWCADWLGVSPNGDVTNPTGPQEGEIRVQRGGSFRQESRLAQSSWRDGNDPSSRHATWGFRLAMVPVSSPTQQEGVFTD